MRKIVSADNLPNKSRNLSSYITKCGSSEKFELLLVKCQLIEQRTFFRNVCCNIFMKQLGNIRGGRNIPPAYSVWHCETWSSRARTCQTDTVRHKAQTQIRPPNNVKYETGALRHAHLTVLNLRREKPCYTPLD
jgi:hypothetical protein